MERSNHLGSYVELRSRVGLIESIRAVQCAPGDWTPGVCGCRNLSEWWIQPELTGPIGQISRQKVEKKRRTSKWVSCP